MAAVAGPAQGSMASPPPPPLPPRPENAHPFSLADDGAEKTTSATREPIFDEHARLEAYYYKRESRFGYNLFLGRRRHFGYWEKDTHWPFPLLPALHAMDDKIGDVLALPPGSRVVDAGCGSGYTAVRLASTRGLHVVGIDLLDRHLAQAEKVVARAVAKGEISAPPPGKEAVDAGKGSVALAKMDYHHLETIPTASVDGVYSMETLTHATDVRAVLAGFRRIVRPGGRVVLHEYDNHLIEGRLDPSIDAWIESSAVDADDVALAVRRGAWITDAASLTAYGEASPGSWQRWLAEAGFVDVETRDYSDNIVPMTRMLYVAACVPYHVVSRLGLHGRFVNTVASYGMYKAREGWRLKSFSARVPLEGEGAVAPQLSVPTSS